MVWSKVIDSDTTAVYSQTFDAAGNRLGGETLVSAGSPMAVMPAVTAIKDGGYVVTWTEKTSGNWYESTTDGNIRSVTVNSDGTVRGSSDTGTHLPSATYLNGTGTLTGTAAVNTLDGRGGATVMNAGSDNDLIIIKDTAFTSVNGGDGTDTLVWSSTANLAYSAIASKVTNIETIHLSDTNANALTLTLSDVLGTSSTSDTLKVQGGTGDSVVLDATWSLISNVTFGGAQYSVYTNQLSKTASLWVQSNTGMTVTLDTVNMPGTAGADTISDNSAANVIEGKAGNDTFNLTSGGHDTLMYELLVAADATGGNGADKVSGFTVGDFNTAIVPSADRIDLGALLSGGVTAANAADYLTVTSNGIDTVLQIDRDGTAGSTYTPTTLLTLSNVDTDLATLLANNQLVLV